MADFGIGIAGGVLIEVVKAIDTYRKVQVANQKVESHISLLID